MTTHFQPPSKSLTPRDYQFIALVVIVFLAICAALLYANLTLKGGGDFYVHWVGARAFLFDKIDPYSGEVAARVQGLVYEGSAKAGDEPYILDTPFQILLLYFPFSIFSNPTVVRAVFTLLLELALFALAVLSLRLTDWESPRFFAILFVFLAVFNFYAFQAVFESSPVLILAFFYAAILTAYRAEADELVGALLSFSLYYWEVGAPFLILFFWRVYREKRSRIFAGFFMFALIMYFVAFLTYPDWVIPFLRATVNNLRADFGFNVHAVLVHLLPAQGKALGWILTIGLVIALGYEWSLAVSGDFRRFYWASCLSLAAAPLLGFRTEMEHLVVLVIPLALVFAVVHDRWRRIGNSLTFLLMLVIFVVPWLLYFLPFTRSYKFASELTFLFLPLSTLIGLYWIRWWAIRPPRLLSDLATHNP
ncbi:MAG: hypothetical protein HY865_25850 [Chloroflexi bacterium]|nr:hypothetical protein [Chloroflexota bacterium]